MARALRESFRASGIPARYGGDEFAVILPESSAEVARIVCIRFCETLRALTGEGSSISCSMGISVSAPAGFVDAEDLVRSADLAMYEAKKTAGCATIVSGQMSTPADLFPGFSETAHTTAMKLSLLAVGGESGAPTGRYLPADRAC